MFEGVSATIIILILIALLLLLIVITLGAVAVYSGLFITPEVGAGKPPIGKVVFAYKFNTGPYKECGQLYTETVIIAPDKKSLGIFYDDPQKVEASKLRYVVGAVISQNSEPVDEELVKKFTTEGFKIITLPEVDHAVKATFPYITSLSIIIGVYKVYPRLRHYVEEKKLCAYPYLEYCDEETTHFFAPLSKQEDFYVPECEEEHGSSDFNEALESTQSTLADSVLDTTLESNDEVTPSAEEELSPEKIIQNLESKEISSNASDGKSDEAVCERTPSDLTDETNGKSDGDVEDNSSSSSFEVVKNENVDV